MASAMGIDAFSSIAAPAVAADVTPAAVALVVALPAVAPVVTPPAVAAPDDRSSVGAAAAPGTATATNGHRSGLAETAPPTQPIARFAVSALKGGGDESETLQQRPLPPGGGDRRGVDEGRSQSGRGSCGPTSSTAEGPRALRARLVDGWGGSLRRTPVRRSHDKRGRDRFGTLWDTFLLYRRHRARERRIESKVSQSVPREHRVTRLTRENPPLPAGARVGVRGRASARQKSLSAACRPAFAEAKPRLRAGRRPPPHPARCARHPLPDGERGMACGARRHPPTQSAIPDKARSAADPGPMAPPRLRSKWTRRRGPLAEKPRALRARLVDQRGSAACPGGRPALEGAGFPPMQSPRVRSMARARARAHRTAPAGPSRRAGAARPSRPRAKVTA